MEAKRMKAWLRLIVVVVLLVIAFLVIFMNRNNRADLWLFHSFRDVAVIWLIVVTGAVAILGTWVVKGIYHAFADVKRPQEK